MSNFFSNIALKKRYGFTENHDTPYSLHFKQQVTKLVESERLNPEKTKKEFAKRIAEDLEENDCNIPKWLYKYLR